MMQDQFATPVDIAESLIGVKEIAGAQHNPKIIEMAAVTGNSWVQDDETPWCAAYVGYCLERANVRCTRSLRARSYETFGKNVPLAKAQRGDVAVFTRGNDGRSGHVGFVWEVGNGWLDVLGGNQGDQVCIKRFGTKKLITIRRYKLARRSLAASKTVQIAAGVGATGAGSIASGLDILDPHEIGGFVAMMGLSGNQALLLLGLGLVAAMVYLIWSRKTKFYQGMR